MAEILIPLKQKYRVPKPKGFKSKGSNSGVGKKTKGQTLTPRRRIGLGAVGK